MNSIGNYFNAHELMSVVLKNNGFKIQTETGCNGEYDLICFETADGNLLRLLKSSWYAQLYINDLQFTDKISDCDDIGYMFKAIDVMSDYTNIDNMIVFDNIAYIMDKIINDVSGSRDYKEHEHKIQNTINTCYEAELCKRSCTDINLKYKKSIKTFKKHWDPTLEKINDIFSYYTITTRLSVEYGKGMDNHAFRFCVKDYKGNIITVSEGNNPIRAICNIRYVKNSNIRKIIQTYIIDQVGLWNLCNCCLDVWTGLSYRSWELFKCYLKA